MTQSWIPLLLLGLVALMLSAAWIRVQRRVKKTAKPSSSNTLAKATQPGSSLRLTALGVLLSGAALVIVPTIPATTAAGLFWSQAAEITAFATLFPFLLFGARRFTLVEIPQWRSVRAFVLGASVLVGIHQIAAVSSADGYQTELLVFGLPANAIVGYLLALLTAGLCAWRLVSTPRQRWVLLQTATIPLLLAGCDWLTRRYGIEVLGQPLISWAIMGSALSLSLLRSRQLTIRPVARSALIDQVQDLLLVADAQQHVADFNDAFSNHLGEKNLLGKRCRGLLPEPLVAALGSDSPLCQVLPWELKGVESWFEVHMTPLMADGCPAGTLVTLRDVTRRRRAEAALEASRMALEEANAQLEQLAHADPLTGLANRRSLMQKLELETERHTRSGLTLGLIVLDLDHFKQVNDQHGHPIGDKVLTAVAYALTSVCRETDVTARLGGEEFAVLAVDSSNEGPALLAERLRAHIAGTKISVDETVDLRVTASFGVAIHSGGSVTPAGLLKLADDALYEAKRQGRNRVSTRAYEPMEVPGAASASCDRS